MKQFIKIAMLIAGISGIIEANSIIGNWHLDRVDSKANSGIEGAYIGFMKQMFEDIKFNKDGSCKAVGGFIKRCYTLRGGRYLMLDQSGKVSGRVILLGSKRIKMLAYNKKSNVTFYYHKVGKTYYKPAKIAIKTNRVYYAKKNGEEYFLLFKKSGDYYQMQSNKKNHTTTRDFKKKIRGEKVNLHNYSFTHSAYKVRAGKYYTVIMGTPIIVKSSRLIKFDGINYRLR